MLWTEIGADSMKAAQKLLNSEDEGDLRSCVSRAYYAAYAAATHYLSPATFARGRGNPSHEQLPILIKQSAAIDMSTRRDIARELRFLRQLRETADYRPLQIIDRRQAVDVVRRAASVMIRLGVPL